MQKFSKEFYASRIGDWKAKYLKVKELIKLIQTIRKDVERNGGQIILFHRRVPTINFDEFARNTLSAQVDRHSVGLDVLEDTEGLFNKNEKIFQTATMYEINELFGELKDLEFMDDMKIFLYYLTIEVHNVYVFYLSIEKNIFKRMNDHSYNREKYKTMTEQELLEELVDLTEITYLMYSFYTYIDLNVQAVQEILKYFDENFQILNHNISMNKLYFKKYLSKKDSDLKYILSFKIIIESCVLIESYYQEISSRSNSKEIKAQKNELKEVLSYLNEKNTDRVNDDIHEVYLKQKNIQVNNIIKQRKNIKFDMQNSFCVDVHQQEDFYKRLGEKEFDEEINIQTTRKNIYNLTFLYFHTFIYSFFYIMPYLDLYFYFLENNIHIYYLGFILTMTHLGNLISRIFINILSERYKIKLIIFCVCFILSFILSIISERFTQVDEDENIFFWINFIARFFYGFSCGRLLTRKYILQFLPESEIKFFSITYLIIIYLGGLCGILINILLKEMKPLYIGLIDLYLENYYFIFGIGAITSIIYLLLIIILFTEPNEATMLEQVHSTSNNKIEEVRLNKDNIEEEKNICDYKELYDENETGDESNKLNNLIFRESSIGAKRNTSNKELIIVSDNVEDMNKTYEEKITKKLAEDILKSNDGAPIIELTGTKNGIKEKDEEESLNTPLNISNIKKESKDTTKLESNNSNKASKDTSSNDILSDEEIKGLNSLEKELIDLNEKNNFDDINLMPNELERIRKNNYKNNKSYLCSFISFINTLLLTTGLNEFTLLSAPLCFYKKDKNITINDVIIIMIVLHLFSFPFLIFLRMMISFNVERRFLLILYAILTGLMALLLLFKFLFFGGIERNDDNFCFILGFVILFVISNLIEGTTHLLSNKIIPSFVKICSINNRYIISYSGVLGKILGGFIFSILCLIEGQNIIFGDTYVFKYNLLIFSSMTIISFIGFIFSYKKLRVRAIAKLLYISD